MTGNTSLTNTQARLYIFVCVFGWFSKRPPVSRWLVGRLVVAVLELSIAFPDTEKIRQHPFETLFKTVLIHIRNGEPIISIFPILFDREAILT